MALIYCPHCGKRISDRTAVCQYCKAVLVQKNDNSPVSNESIFTEVKKNICGVIIAAVEALVLTRLFGVVLGIICKLDEGEYGWRVFTKGSRASQLNILFILIVGLIGICILPSTIEKITKMKARTFIIAISLILSIVFGISYSWGTSTITLLLEAKDLGGNSIVGEDIVEGAKMVVIFYAVTIPLYQGMFYILYKNGNGKKIYITQVVFAMLALLLTIIFAVIGVKILKLFIFGAVFAGALASFITFVVATVWRK